MSREEGAVATLQRTQFCTFRVEELLVGIDVQVVQEVIRAQEMRTVPLSPTRTNSLVGSPEPGSWSTGGTTTRPSAVLLPHTSHRARPARNRPVAPPTVR